MPESNAATEASRFTIRPFTDDDYPSIAEVLTAVWPEYPETAGEMRQQDSRRDPKTRWSRFIATASDGTVISAGDYGQSSDMYHPRRFSVDVSVHPEWRRRGIGAAMYDALVAALEPFEPLSLRCMVREDRPESLAFVARRGFVEEMRERESRLDLSAFDPAAFAGSLERAAAEGIVVRTAREQRESDPDFFARAADLYWAIAQDIPSPAPPTRQPYDVFLKRFESPNYLWDGNFYALDRDGRYVGHSGLWSAQTSDDLYTGVTGVVRDCRGRGIATALKVRALTWAKEGREAAGVRTWNEVGNAGMLGINQRLGFVWLPAWLNYILPLRDEPTAAAADI